VPSAEFVKGVRKMYRGISPLSYSQVADGRPALDRRSFLSIITSEKSITYSSILSWRYGRIILGELPAWSRSGFYPVLFFGKCPPPFSTSAEKSMPMYFTSRPSRSAFLCWETEESGRMAKWNVRTTKEMKKIRKVYGIFPCDAVLVYMCKKCSIRWEKRAMKLAFESPGEFPSKLSPDGSVLMVRFTKTRNWPEFERCSNCLDEEKLLREIGIPPII